MAANDTNLQIRSNKKKTVAILAQRYSVPVPSGRVVSHPCSISSSLEETDRMGCTIVDPVGIAVDTPGRRFQLWYLYDKKKYIYFSSFKQKNYFFTYRTDRLRRRFHRCGHERV